MQNISLYTFMVFFIPVISDVFMLTILGWDIIDTDRHSRKPKIWLFCCIFVWMLSIFTPIIYYGFPHVYVYINWLYYLTVMLYPVLFYRFIFMITRISTDCHFSWMHYAFPALITVLMIVSQLITPYSEQLYAVTRNIPSTSSFFGIVTGSKVLVKLLYQVVYLVVCFLCLKRYRRFITNYSSNESKSSLRWIYLYLWILLLPTFVSVLLVILPHDVFFKSPFIPGPILLVPFFHAFLVYHTMKGDYIITESENISIHQEHQEQPNILKKSVLSKAFFEEYINKQRPYLNPDLKIVDLVGDLQLNRTYISGFINSEYNMNFSQYINQCRLNEYYRMRSDPAYSAKSAEELCILAGFSNFRYFQRLEKEQSKNSQ